ncbi:hypothetical protein IQ06DRAFT_331667 [Phaeosphaeriaceae sp. SRC1lsM3a]|nr:hypothetical protein IQ06DRAFT_331667 [Stagonospora sp. SRC1lsM3a]
MSLQASPAPSWTSVVVGPTTEVVTSNVAVFTEPTENSGATPVFTEPAEPSATNVNGGYSHPVVYYPKSKSNAGAIAGGVVGGLAVVAIAVVVLYWIRRRYPKSRHVNTETLPAPPHYDVQYSTMSGVTQPARVSVVEQPAHVYKSEGLGAKEGMDPITDEKHVEVWPVDKKM